MQQQGQVSKPWWKYGYMWLVVGGPAAVVVAGLVTFWIAAHGADPVVDADYYRHGVEINKRLKNPEKSMAPAQKMRNFATTPDEDLPILDPSK